MDEKTELAEAAEELGTDKPKFVGGRYLILATAFILAGGAWLFFGINIAIDHFRERAPEWLNRPLNQIPEWIGIAWASITVMLPSAMLLLFSAHFIKRVDDLNRSLIYEANLQDLSKARAALKQGLASLGKIERDFKLKVASFDRLQKQIDELSSLRDVDVAHVQRMLNAMAHASRRKIWAGRIGLFLAGIATSLLGAFIWDVFAS